MGIWLKQGKESYRFAVLPPSIEPSVSMQNTSVNITNYGEINLIGKRGLKTLSLSSFFPKQKYNFVQYKDFPSPKACISLIDSWMDNPVRLIITDANINMLVTIESFNHAAPDANGDVYFTLELKEYKKPTFKKKAKSAVNKTSKTVQKAETQRESKKVKSTTYTVKSGDTLSQIAKRLTGDSANYKAIANQNGISNPGKIAAGQKLVIKI
ncbi:LysM peptidoglycan-binding domain-containing protein [Anaerocolumna jejuensis]|uniref:LysM peptidoglycan-binding domain-containing protein n=1 Tax=Anaerocolumna jejuensis TaxID=259063 RepID=UPI003F7B76C4